MGGDEPGLLLAGLVGKGTKGEEDPLKWGSSNGSEEEPKRKDRGREAVRGQGLFDRLREGNVEGRREQLRGYLVEMKMEIWETKEMGGLYAEGGSFWSAEGKKKGPGREKGRNRGEGSVGAVVGCLW
ncbi:hypothetical protein H0E87_000067, partial [Populus deltoides]